MSGGDNIYVLQAKLFDRRYRRVCLTAVRQYNVGVVLARLFHNLAVIAFIVKACRGSIVLSKRIIGEENLIDVGVGNHIVGPMHHRRLHKVEGTLANAQGVSRFYTVDLKIFSIKRFKFFNALRSRGIHGSIWCHLEHGRQRAGVIHLNMVAHHNVNLCRINNALDALDKLICHGVLNRIDKRDLLVQNKIRIIGNALLSGIPMELPGVPINGTNGIHIRLNLHCTQHMVSSVGFGWLLLL